ncbi:hypothetical protein ACLB2K_025153 [Fragaria x ananassa]
MEISPRRETNPNPNSLPSPNSSTSSTNSNKNNNNNVNGLQLQAPPTTPTAQPPKPMTRSDPANPYPTTFVQADTNSFKQVVQMLTGSSETANKVACSKHNIPPIKSTPKKQQQHQHQHNNNSGFKLYERRNNAFKNQLRLNPLSPIPVFNSNSNSHSSFSPRNPEILSPSILDFPALVLSPVTPLIPDPFDRAGSGNFGHGCSQLNKEAEEKAIKEKGFYLHRSPSTTPRESEPRLLPLFPTTSPRASGNHLGK